MPERLSMLGMNPTAQSTGGPTRVLDDEFLAYLNNSAEGLQRMGVEPQTVAGALPGGGIVKGNREMLQSGQHLNEGNYLAALGTGLSGTLDTALGVVPGGSAAKATAEQQLAALMARYGIRR